MEPVFFSTVHRCDPVGFFEGVSIGNVEEPIWEMYGNVFFLVLSESFKLMCSF